MNWEQFRAILWLRWRLSRNQLMRGGKVGAVIAAVAGVGMVLIGIVVCAGAAVISAALLKSASANIIMVAWDVAIALVLFFSVIGVLTELQRSESVDLTRLLHLPIGLKQVFVFNYLVSLVSLGSVLMLGTMLGLVTGLVVSRGLVFILLVPLVIAFVFMLTAWVYCLRGWLLSLMVNPRRRRSIIMWITLAVVLVGQTPQLIHFVVPRKGRRSDTTETVQKNSSTSTNQIAQAKGSKANETGADTQLNERKALLFSVAQLANQWVPLFWLPNSARGLAEGRVWPAIWGAAGMLALGWWGLSRAYRATLKFYRADERARPIKDGPAKTAGAKPARNWVEIRLPWLADDTAALALSQFRSMTRAPEVRMMLAMGLFMGILLPGIIFWRAGGHLKAPEMVKPFMATSIVVLILFSLLQLVSNQFGCDREGFRGLLLLPTERHRLLFGKNLALFPLAIGIALIPLIVASLVLKLGLLTMLATFSQLLAAFLIFFIVGNLSSILIPFRIAPGSLKPTKQSWKTVVGLLIIHLMFPLLLSPIFAPPLLDLLMRTLNDSIAGLVNLFASACLVLVCGVLYWLSLRPLGRFLQQGETRVLSAVTEVTE